jgi:hypothetical protein
MDRRTRRLIAIGWLLLLHALADVTLAMYRCHDIAPHLTDPLIAALSISQVCLLAAWLAVGYEALTWRICGFVAGLAFIINVFTRLLFPGFAKAL